MNTSHPLLTESMKPQLVLGNEAIVRGALEAGVAFACGYPGTASSEITDAFRIVAQSWDVEFEYSVNEKIALEMAYAASLAGARSLTAMKHLGLAYAGDPLSTIPYMGTVGGMVIVSTGDPGCRTSPNESDQRQLAAMLNIPTLDPSTAQEALDMTRYAFELSEYSQMPVLLRPTTRVCHTRSSVVFGSLRAPQSDGRFERDPERFVPVPSIARKLRVQIPARLERASASMRGSGFLSRVGDGPVAVVTSGAVGATCMDVLAGTQLESELAVVRVGALFPVPEAWLLSQLRGLSKIIVVEELSPYLEDAVRSLCQLHGLDIEVVGKRTGHFPFEFEYSEQIVTRGIGLALRNAQPEDRGLPVIEDSPAPVRGPVLCAGCGHRSAFLAARASFGDQAIFANDIGCYTLGFSAPLHGADVLVSMGSSIPLADGMSRMTGERAVAFIGDSTFFHSGMPALLNAIRAKANVVIVVMDNQVVAMTGFQPSPAIRIEDGVISRDVDIEEVARVLGARDVVTVNPDDLKATTAAFESARDATGVSVVVVKKTCVVFQRKLTPEVPQGSFKVDHDRCMRCGRSACGQRCDVGITRGLQLSMTRARSLQSAGDGLPVDVAPCAQKCPLHLCVQGYSGHIAAGEYTQALELIVDKLPLPGTICRVCDRPCESACVRSQDSKSVAINDLKRFVVDWADQQSEYPYRPEVEPSSGLRVAVVGAGPSGLAASSELCRRGYSVVLLDSESAPGGLLRTAIPSARLPQHILDRDVGRILELGVRFLGDRVLGRDVMLADLVDEFDAVFLAIGAGLSRPFFFEGAGVKSVAALSYLRAVRAGESLKASHVVVVGGGNSAIDAARVARRGGAEGVVVACVEPLNDMPAIASEVIAAEREGIEFLPEHRVLRVSAGEVVLCGVDPSFHLQGGNEVTVSAELLISAVGQFPDLAVLEGERGFELSRHEDGTLVVDPVTRQTSQTRVFAGGDLSQPAPGIGHTVVAAIADGLRAAWGIDRELRGREKADTRMPPPRVARTLPVLAVPSARKPGRSPGGLDWVGRPANDEVSSPLSELDARTEAARCMSCGECGNCRSCLDLFGCPAFYLHKGAIEIDSALCTGCGVCAEFCPNQAIVPLEIKQ